MTMLPTIELNIIAITVASVSCFFFAYTWFTVLFGRVWAVEMGMAEEPKCSGKYQARGMALTFAGIILMVCVLANQIAVWTPTSWGIDQEINPPMQIISAGFFPWLGFVVWPLLNLVAWAKHSWKLFAINAGYYLLALLLAASILVSFS